MNSHLKPPPESWGAAAVDGTGMEDRLKGHEDKIGSKVIWRLLWWKLREVSISLVAAHPAELNLGRLRRFLRIPVTMFVWVMAKR